MQAVMFSRYLYRDRLSSRGVYAGFSSCRPRYCRISMCFLCFWGLWNIFSSEIPLFLFSGVFLKLFLYRPLPRIEKQVTLDFWYLRTNFFRIDPTLRNSQVTPSNLLFTPSDSHVLIDLSFMQRRFYYALRTNSKRTAADSTEIRFHSS